MDFIFFFFKFWTGVITEYMQMTHKQLWMFDFLLVIYAMAQQLYFYFQVYSDLFIASQTRLHLPIGTPLNSLSNDHIGGT